ncbi:COP9 signalosome complex subunit 4 [Yarrowia sp. B02]|nr:COP9 signalosome complex subunit 4 [Yarrowia sp. B02]
MSVSQKIEAIAAAKTGAKDYIDYLHSLSSPDELIAFAKEIVQIPDGAIVARPVLAEFVTHTKSLADVREDVLVATLDVLKEKTIIFEEQEFLAREALAEVYEQQSEYTKAARVLQGMRLDSGQQHITDDQKVAVYVRIVRMLLEDEDDAGAETYLNKCALLIHKCSDPVQKVHFKLSQARIFDTRRKFLDATRKYYEMSLEEAVDPEDRLQCLLAASKTAILSPAGPLRQRVLTALYKDERSVQLPTFKVLEQLYENRILDQEDVKQFAEMLEPHQLALMGDGVTVLDRAVLEHNLLAISRVFSCISFPRVAALIGMELGQAEDTVANMIIQGRLSGRIDQVSGFVYFDSEKSQMNVRQKALVRLDEVADSIERIAA